MKPQQKIVIYDTTLRDGTQSRDVNLTIQDKITLLKHMNEIKIPYAELGWPGSNPKDMEVFLEAKKLQLQNTKISAFCSTKRKDIRAEDDQNLKAAIECLAPTVCIFGKIWSQHIEKQLQCTLQENLEAIKTSIEFLIGNKREVFFDAEHFFDGYKENPKYAIECIICAYHAGASCVVLCDTNGGTLPNEILEIVETVIKNNPAIPLGIHVHNDGGCAVANSLIASQHVKQIQGTLNGIGERCGNADLCQIIPALELKQNILTGINLQKLKELSDIVYVLANIPPQKNQPYVGTNAFAHKGGIHVDAISKGAIYEHINPKTVGNQQIIVLSDLSGTANIVETVKQFSVLVDKKDPRVHTMLTKVKELEKAGYNIGDITAEKYLLTNEFFIKKKSFGIKNWSITTKKIDDKELSECTIELTFDNDAVLITKTVVVEDGPVDAVYKTIQSALLTQFPIVREIKLINFKVMIAEAKGVESSVRVYIEFEKGISNLEKKEFATCGVSTNILEASVEAIEKGFRYAILTRD